MSQCTSALRLVRDVLGADVVGAYLHGSAVQGGLRPHSDIDVLVVSRRRTAIQERRALIEGLLGISGVYLRRGPARPVELTLVVPSDLYPWRYPPRCEFQYGEWLRPEFERGDTPSPFTSPDLALLVTMVRQGNSALFGPSPDKVLDPVPWEDLERALVAGVPDLLAELESDTRNVVLTLARIWMTLATGTISSKKTAADWALEHLSTEHRLVLARVQAIYLGHTAERWDDLLPRVRPHAHHVLDVIERLSARGGAGETTPTPKPCRDCPEFG